jgi:hypothetical protein
LEIANNRYKAGLVIYLEVAAAQSAALNQERSGAASRPVSGCLDWIDKGIGRQVG